MPNRPRIQRNQSIPVLKMPPELALPALRILGARDGRTDHEIRKRLHELRRSIPSRTLLNAYVFPSLKQLELYEGSLASGHLTRFGREVFLVTESGTCAAAEELVARQLVDIDFGRVGLLEWLVPRARELARQPRKDILRLFLADSGQVALSSQVEAAALDRLGKWLSYLAYFGVIREATVAGEAMLTVDARHVSALRARASALPPQKIQRNGLLDAYSRQARRLGTRLYIPIVSLRDELGAALNASGFLLTDAAIDKILTAAPELLQKHVVSYSPYSGPARGGVALSNMYAGFISIRPRSADDSREIG